MRLTELSADERYVVVKALDKYARKIERGLAAEPLYAGHTTPERETQARRASTARRLAKDFA